MSLAQLERYLDPGRSINWREHRWRFQNVRDDLYWEAVRVRETEATNYRGFLVGCAAYVFNARARTFFERWRIVTGANSKDSKDAPKICAERRMHEEVERTGGTLIIGMVIVGEPQLDDHSQILCPTLHPCHVCRQMLSTSPFLRPDSTILTARPPFKKGRYSGTPLAVTPDHWLEEHSMREVLSKHREPYPYL